MIAIRTEPDSVIFESTELIEGQQIWDTINILGNGGVVDFDDKISEKYEQGAGLIVQDINEAYAE